MGHQRLRYCLMVIMLLIPSICHGEPVPKKSRKLAFGAGLLGGVLTGAVISKALPHNNAQNTEQHIYHHFDESTTSTQQPQINNPTIQNGPILANGCYEQTLHEPNLQNPAQFTETIRMICPSPVTEVAAPQQMMSQMPQQYLPVPPHAYPQQNPPIAPQTIPAYNIPVVSQASYPPQNPPIVVPQQNPLVQTQAYPQQNTPLAPAPVVPQQNLSVAPQFYPQQNPPLAPIAVAQENPAIQPQAYPQQNPPLASTAPQQNPPSVLQTLQNLQQVSQAVSQLYPSLPQEVPQQTPQAEPIPQQTPPVAIQTVPQQNPLVASQLFPPHNPPQGVLSQNLPATSQAVPQPNLPQVVAQQPPAQVYVVSTKTGYYTNNTKSNAMATRTSSMSPLLLISIIFVFLSKSI